MRNKEANIQLRIMGWLVRTRATSTTRSIHFWIILGSLAVFGYLYYGVVSAFYDIYVILFFFPLLYASVVYRLKGVIVCGLVFLFIVLPHTFLFSYDSYLLARTLIFTALALLLSSLIATLLNYLEKQLAAYEETESLTQKLNSSMERLESTQKQLIQAGKVNAIGQLTASIAHEINNPLAGVLVYSKLLVKKINNDIFNKEEVLADLLKIDSAVSHCSKIIRGLLDFARQSPPVPQSIVICDVIDQLITLVGHKAEMNGIKIVREEASGLPMIMVDPGQLQQVFMNLALNAIQAMPDGGNLTIRTAPAEGNLVMISIQDTGCGITSENLNKVFTPFFTTKEKEKGIGLGLAISYGIVERHGGKIEVNSLVGKGSIFTVYLPAYMGESSSKVIQNT